MVEIECITAAYFRQGGMVRQEDRLLIIHGLYHRKTESFSQRREEKSQAVLDIPVFYRFRYRTGNENPVFHTVFSGLFDYLLFVAGPVSGYDQLIVIVLEQSRKDMKILFGKYGPYREEERPLRYAFRSSYVTIEKVKAVVYDVHFLPFQIDMGLDILSGIFGNGDYPVSPVDSVLDPSQVLRMLVGRLVIQEVQVMDRKHHSGTFRRQITAALICGMPHVYPAGREINLVQCTQFHVGHSTPPSSDILFGNIKAHLFFLLFRMACETPCQVVAESE